MGQFRCRKAGADGALSALFRTVSWTNVGVCMLLIGLASLGSLPAPDYPAGVLERLQGLPGGHTPHVLTSLKGGMLHSVCQSAPRAQYLVGPFGQVKNFRDARLHPLFDHNGSRPHHLGEALGGHSGMVLGRPDGAA